MSTKDLSSYFTITNVNPKKMPKAKVWAFVGLPKRGKTYGASRFNSSSDVTKTIFIDLEMCSLEYPEYNGLNVLPVISYDAPRRTKRDEKGNAILSESGAPITEVIPTSERDLYVEDESIPAYSMREVLVILKAMDKAGLLRNYETLVIDTVDKLQALVEEFTVEEYNKKHPQDKANAIGEIGEYGAGWDSAKKRLINGTILEIKAICARNQLELCLCIHSKTTTQMKGKQQRDPALRQGNTLSLFGEVAAIGYIDNEPTALPDGANSGSVKNGKQYTISFVSNSEETTGGSRFNKLVGKTLPFSYAEIKKEYES